MMGSQVEGYDTDGEPYDKEERIRRKLNMEDHVISGFDTPKQQQEVIFLFWEKIWPELETAGWTKVSVGFRTRATREIELLDARFGVG
jgi:hypothetical protein